MLPVAGGMAPGITSMAYNLSAYGPILPIGSNGLTLTPISPFRPRRWRDALLPRTVKVGVTVLDSAKHPVGASADSFEVKNVVEVCIGEDALSSVCAMFDERHSLEERILADQFQW